MTANSITKDKLISSAHEIIYSHINNRYYVKDPRNPLGVDGRVFVYDSDPLIMALNFEDFPYIVVDFPTSEDLSKSINTETKIIQWTQTITVRTIKDGAGNSRLGVGKNDLHDIEDDLKQSFNYKSRLDELRALNVWNTELEKIDTTPRIINNRLTYESTFTLKYHTRLGVSD